MYKVREGGREGGEEGECVTFHRDLCFCGVREIEKERILYRGEKGGKECQEKKWQLKCCYKKVWHFFISDVEICFGRGSIEQHTGKEGAMKYRAMVRAKLCPVKNFLTVLWNAVTK